MKKILPQLKTLGDYALFAVLFTCGVYGIGFLAISADEQTPSLETATATAHLKLECKPTFDGCRRVAGK